MRNGRVLSARRAADRRRVQDEGETHRPSGGATPGADPPASGRFRTRRRLSRGLDQGYSRHSLRSVSSRRKELDVSVNAVPEERAGGPLDVLFIAGDGRSGSTLLARVLGQSTGAFSAGEVR